MKTFRCQCGNRVFFLNSRCVNCNRELGYFPRLGQMGTLEAAGPQLWVAPGVTPADSRYRKCNNYTIEVVCNWMVEAGDPDPFCWSCRLNTVIPDLSRPRHREYWYKIESAKRYMLYGLYQLRLPVISKKHDTARGLAFTFLADANSAIEFNDSFYGQEAVLTGHNNGLITINLAEADDVARTRLRE
ncbi:MAG: putative zinc-binding metallopeptidase, partial [Nevskiales bacterium]